MNLPQAIGLTKVANARELGGYATKDGCRIREKVLLRSGALHGLTREEEAVLQAYGLHTVIDFRDDSEVAREPDTVPAGVAYVFLPVIENAKNNPAAKAAMLASQSLKGISPETAKACLEAVGGVNGVKRFMTDTYRGIARSKASAGAYRRFFEILLECGEQDGALLFHCRAGKDRTGIAAALLLTALGVDQNTVLEDYLLTNSYMSDGIMKELEPVVGKAALDEVAPLLGVDEENLNAFYEEIAALYGSIEQYLTQALGLDDQKVRRLRACYTEE